MHNSAFVIENERFYLSDPSKYLICGILPERYTLTANLDKEDVPVELSFPEVKSAMERFRFEQQLGAKRAEALLTLPENLGDYKKLDVFARERSPADVDPACLPALLPRSPRNLRKSARRSAQGSSAHCSFVRTFSLWADRFCTRRCSSRGR